MESNKQVNDELNLQPNGSAEEPQILKSELIESEDVKPNENFSVNSHPSELQLPSNENQGKMKNSILKRFAPALISAAITLIFYYAILGILKPGSFLPRLFMPEGATLFTILVPVLTLFFFLWSIADMVIIILTIKNEDKLLLLNKELFRSVDKTNGHLNKIRSEWKGKKSSKAYIRISSLLDTISTAKSAQSVYELFRYQTELDTEKASSKYTLTKIAIWAMPILGFIGTVLGISMAVGNFSGFLTQDIDNIDTVKGELSKVATGLSFAFDTTLFGLVLSLIAMFISTFVQNFEQKFLTQLEEAGNELIENSNIEEVIKVQGIHAGTAPEGMLEKFNTLIDEKVNQVSVDIATILEQLGITAKSITTEFSKIPIEIENSSKSLINQLNTASGNVAKQFEQLPSKINDSFNTLNNSLVNTTKSISAEFEKIPEVLNANNKNYQETIELVTKQLETMKNGFDELSKKSSEFYAVDLGPVLLQLQKNQEAILPVLQTLSKPTEIIVTTRKE